MPKGIYKRKKKVSEGRVKAMSYFKHDFLAERNIKEACIVLRIDDFKTEPYTRGQYYPVENDEMRIGAIWPSYELAEKAALWAVGKNKNKKYGVFKLTSIVETLIPPTPTKITKI